MSADREVDVDVDLDLEENAATAVVVEEVAVDDVFDENGELRLWEDAAGWSGYRREVDGDDVVYYHVNTRHDKDSWIRKVRVGEQAVRDAVTEHIKDPNAGGVGVFVRRCSPP